MSSDGEAHGEWLIRDPSSSMSAMNRISPVVVDNESSVSSRSPLATLTRLVAVWPPISAASKTVTGSPAFASHGRTPKPDIPEPIMAVVISYLTLRAHSSDGNADLSPSSSVIFNIHFSVN